MYFLNILFALQEIILSSMYVYLFFRFVRGCHETRATHPHQLSTFSKRDRRTLILLILVQLVVLITDTTMVALAYLQFSLLRMAMVNFTYALKLRLEFVVLNRLAGRDKVRIEIVDLE